jgi:RimJ/RimL family protein N-acetyltransferase
MKKIRIKNRKIIIRKAIKSDASELVNYLNSISKESDYLTFGEGEVGVTIKQEEEFIEAANNKNNSLFIVAQMNGKIMGNLNFSAGERKRIAHTGEFGVSVLKEYWGNKVGEELVKYLIQWSKSSAVIRKINLRVRTDNTKAIKLYKKLGFFEEGIIKRDFLIENKFYDSLSMGLLID